MTNMVTTAAQQLTLFPGTFPPLVTLRSTPASSDCDRLIQYTDLSLAQATALSDPRQATTVTRNAFRRAGWIYEDGTLTETGTAVLNRAQTILAGARPPDPVLDTPGSVRFRIRHADQWRAVHLKCLLYLARFPYTAWRYLTGIFSVPVVETLQRADLIAGNRQRGALQRITKDGLDVLKGALEHAGVTYYLQAQTYN